MAMSTSAMDARSRVDAPVKASAPPEPELTLAGGMVGSELDVGGAVGSGAVVDVVAPPVVVVDAWVVVVVAGTVVVVGACVVVVVAGFVVEVVLDVEEVEDVEVEDVEVDDVEEVEVDDVDEVLDDEVVVVTGASARYVSGWMKYVTSPPEGVPRLASTTRSHGLPAKHSMPSAVPLPGSAPPGKPLEFFHFTEPEPALNCSAPTPGTSDVVSLPEYWCVTS